MGRYVVQELKQQGYWVRALARSTKRLDQKGKFGEPAIIDLADEIFIGEITKPETLKGMLDGIDLVYSSIGITRQKDGLSFWEVDYQGNKNLLDIVVQHPIEKFVFVSLFRGAELAEKINVAKAREALVNDLVNSGVNYSIIRPSGYYSDMSEFITMASQGWVFVVGDGSGIINPIHGADLATLCVKAFQDEAKEVPCGGQEVFSYQRIGEMAFDVLGKKSKFMKIPVWMAKVLVVLIKPFNKQQADLFSFFILAARNTNLAPKHGSHKLKNYFIDFALLDDSGKSPQSTVDSPQP